MTVTTSLAGAAAALVLLAGCGSDEKPSPPLTQPTASATTPSATPSASASASSDGSGSAAPTTAKDLVGDWSAPDADWTVHFKADGTYTTDYQGVDDFTSGSYELSNGIVKLVGGDGETDQGTVVGSGLKFNLGTLKRSSGTAQ